MIAQANGYMLSTQKKEDDDNNQKPPTGNGTGKSVLSDSKPDNRGIMILDASCVPVNIRYPQDVSLLNEAREKIGNHSLSFP